MASVTGSFSGLPVPGAVAVELGRQVTSGTAQVAALAALGVPPALAVNACAAMSTSDIAALTLANLINYPTP